MEVQPTRSAERGMTGEGQLLLRGEDTDAHPFGEIMLWIVRGQDKRGLGQVRFACDGLHLCIGETAAIVEHSERITLKRMLGEDVEDGVLELAIHGVESTGG